MRFFSIALIFGLINCSAYAAVDSFWKTEQIYHQVSFTSLVDENLFTSLRMFEVENDIPKTKNDIKTLKSIYNVKYLNSGNLKLALANLVRSEHNLARVSISQVTRNGIEQSNKKTLYENLLSKSGSKESLFEYSALIKRRGILINVPNQFVEMANVGCKTKPLDYVEDANSTYENFCTEEELNTQYFIQLSKKQTISSGLIVIKNKETNEIFKIDVVIALDTSDISCGSNATCVSTKYSLANAFKSLDYKDNKKMEVGVYLYRQQYEDEYTINFLNQELKKLNDI